MVVVLPAPFGPMRPMSPPGGTVKEIPSTAVTPPKRTVRSSGRQHLWPGRDGTAAAGLRRLAHGRGA